MFYYPDCSDGVTGVCICPNSSNTLNMYNSLHINSASIELLKKKKKAIFYFFKYTHILNTIIYFLVEKTKVSVRVGTGYTSQKIKTIGN